MSSMYKELSTDNDIETIKGIRFCILSPQEIERMSVAEIFKTDTYISSEPVVNGLFDPRMGVLDHNKICQTCEQKNTFCPGHFGHINLAKPVFNIQFFDVVKKLLKCVCFRCSKLLINSDSPQMKAMLAKKYSRQKRWEMIYKLCTVKRCGGDTIDGCGAKQPDKIYREPIVKIVMEWKDMQEEQLRKQVFNAEEVIRILKRISDKDAEVLGFSKKFNRPEWMICTTLPVPPPAVRPSVRTDTGQRSEDDLTHKLCDIVKSNNLLKSKIEKGASKEQIDITTQVLQYHVATFIDNKIPGISPAQQRTGRLLKSLTERLKSKDGRIRGNLMGKRVDFSARSVITPDPNISIDELGVPIKIAMNLTFPDIVNKYNREKLMQYVINGADTYPGAKFIRSGNWTKALKNMSDRDKVVLNDGDIVDRHLIDGDFVLFNRQPSLHKYSMLCHRVKVMPYNTFRLNTSVCVAYNADFDGDEMNMHVPQSLTTANEIAELASVTSQIISARDCKPLIAIVQDVALGVYRFTKSNVTLSEKQVFNLLASNVKFNGIVPPPSLGNKWTGRQVMSTIIPKSINLRAKNKSFEEKENGPFDKENYVIIENGELKQGIVDKTIYQSRTKGLIHSIYNECSPHETRVFFDNTQKLICDWLVMSGFSVGVSDLIIDNETSDNLKKQIHSMKVNVYNMISDIHMGTMQNMSINDNNSYFENEVNKILNQTISKVGKTALENIDDLYNRMINMVKSGSKGSIINVSQMIACLGQQNVDGKRIPYGFEDRTLPHYTKYDDGPESRGFVENSFITGLSPQEFFFHAMGGREGLIDTAVKTSEVGYLQRKLVKAMEDCKINYDYTVRNASGSIIQFLYGEDGIDPTKIESQHIQYIDMSMDNIQKGYLITRNDPLDSILDPVTYKEVSTDWDKVEKLCMEHFEQLLNDRLYMIQSIFENKKETSIMYPISFERLINNTKALFNKVDKGVYLDITPSYIITTVNKLCDELYVNKDGLGNKFGNKLVGILLRCYMSPKKVIMDYKFGKLAFDRIIQQIRMRFYDAIAHPSEMVGVIAAQSMGEPMTQMTLNTFHLSGVSSASKAVRGVPRIKELLSVTKNMKSPSLTVYIKQEYNKDKKICKDILTTIETTYFSEIVNSTKIYYDPDDFNTTIESDRKFIESYKDFVQEDMMQEGSSSPWLLRLDLNKAKMLEHNIYMIDLHRVLLDFYEGKISMMYSDDNAENLIFRIKIYEEEDTSKDIITDLKALEKNILENVIIKGVKNINKVSMSKKSYMQYEESDTFEQNHEWVLETNGSNLLDILAHPKIDNTRTVSNNINEIYEIFGIEAARQALYNEISEVIKDADLYVNYRHLALLVDTMTNKGYLLSIDRHGINRVDIGPLAKSSFEETTDMLIKAGIFSEVDKINGVSANIILGQIPPCGTGDSEILVDELKLSELMSDYQQEQSDDEDNDQDQAACELDNLDFDFKVPERDLTISKKDAAIKIV